MSEPVAVAVAQGVAQGEVQSVVSGVALGAPVPQAPKASAQGTAISDGASSSADSSAAVATAFVYTPFLAKVFHDMDVNKNGLVEEDELTAALIKLGFQDKVTLSSFDTNNDGKIDLSEWEAGLSPELREAIMAKAE